MSVEEKIAKKGNMGYHNGEQTIVSWSALKNGREEAKAKSKTALLKKL